MSQDTSMQKVSFYSATMWKAIFDGLTRMLADREETSFTLVTYGADNFVRDSIGENNEIDSNKLYSNIGCYFECDPIVKDDLLKPFIREKISFAALERIDQEPDGKGTRVRCCFAVDAKDAERAKVIADRVNRGIDYANDLTPRELSDYCEQRQINLCGTDRIDGELVRMLRDENMLGFLHAFVKNTDGKYTLRFPSQYEEQAQEAFRKAIILCSGLTRETMEQGRQESERELANVLAKAVDNGKSYIIIDAERPDHYVRTDSSGLHVIAVVKDGKEQELQHIERNSPRLQESVYNILSEYARPVAIEAADRNLDEKIEKIREEARAQKEPGLMEKVEYYKRGFSSYIMECLERAAGHEERGYDGRLKDNAYSFAAAIDHAVITKQDALAGDLKSDKDLNARAIEKSVPESAIDLSDLNGGDTFEQVFCHQLIGPASFYDLDERRSFEESIIRSEVFKELSQEQEEVKEIVMREIGSTYDEVIETDYEFTDITRAEYAREIDELDKEANEIHMEMDIEYDR